jgi:hypothetical protein
LEEDLWVVPIVHAPSQLGIADYVSRSPCDKEIRLSDQLAVHVCDLVLDTENGLVDHPGLAPDGLSRRVLSVPGTAPAEVDVGTESREMVALMPVTEVEEQLLKRAWRRFGDPLLIEINAQLTEGRGVKKVEV